MNIIVEHEKIRSEKNENVDIFDDPLTDDVLKDLVDFTQNIRERYDDVEDGNIDKFLREQSQIFGLRNDLGNREISAVQEILREDLMSYRYPKEIILPESDEKITEEDRAKIKSLVKENLRSAALNYIRFVLPHENTSEYEEKARNFWEKEANYIVEDLGYKNPYAEKEAIEELKHLLPGEVHRINPKRSDAGIGHVDESNNTKEKTMVERQKAAVRRLVKKYGNAYQSIDKDNATAMDALMQEVRMDIANVDDLHDHDLDKTVDVFGKFMPFVIEKAQERAGKDEALQEMQVDGKETSVKEDVTKTDHEKTLGGDPEKADIPTEEKIAVLKQGLDDARSEYARKKVAHESAWKKITHALGGVYKKNDDDMNAIRSAYETAYVAYRSAYVEHFMTLSKEEQKKKLIESLDIDHHEKIAFYDATTVAKAEKINTKISSLVQKLELTFQKIPRYAKRAAVVTFLVAGMFFGGQQVMNDQGAEHAAESVDRATVSYALPAVKEMQFGAHVDAERFRTLIQQYRTEADARLLGNAYESYNNVQDDSESEMNSVEAFSNDAVEIHGVVTVEKDSSVEKAIAEYLAKQELQGTVVDHDPPAIAHLLVQQYEKEHVGVDLDRVHPGTTITIGKNAGKDGEIVYAIKTIDFPNGPHIASDREKIKHTITQYSSPAEETQHIKSLLKDPAFNKKIAQQISHVFDAKDINEIKQIAHKPLRSFFRMNDNDHDEITTQQRADLQDRLSRIIENAQEIYGDAGMPRDHASVQSYFIRIYARAQKDDLVKEIFSV
jgi:hypothetical protein